MIAALSALPSIEELASMWPAWIILVIVGSLYVYCEIKDRQEWGRFQKRMKRREMQDRQNARLNRRN